METGMIVLLVLVLTVMAVGLLGLIFPVLPGLTIIWLGALVYALADGLNWGSGIIFVLMTLMMLGGNVVDNLAMGASARVSGAGWISIGVALLCGLAGMWLLPPIGGLLGALLGLFIAELVRLRWDWKKALESAKGMAVGCGWAAVLRFSIGLLMVGLFLIWVWVA